MSHQKQKLQTASSFYASLGLALLCVTLLVQADSFQQPARQRRSQLAARRAADDSRPLSRVQREEAQIVLGKFKAPAPDQVHMQRIPAASEFGSHTMAASFRVADRAEGTQTEKVVHGIAGRATEPQFGRPRKVSAKIMVSDEGLNLPPSKLSADIHGNVAEIVTAPPDSVDSDLFLPPASKLFGRRQSL